MLLSLFLYNLVGFYPAYTWRQHQFRKQAERQRRIQLPDQALVRIQVARLGRAELHWQESHEFRWRGQLYDVVRQHATADSITYFCWHDRGEEKLLAGLQKHVQELTRPGPDAGKAAKKLLEHLFKLAFLAQPSPEQEIAFRRVRRPLPLARQLPAISRPAAVVQPPPERPAATS